jgi:low temperature requirement protein LtrA
VSTPPEAPRVSTLELFFDLVFVFTITQLTTLLLGDLTVHGLACALLVIGLIWWMYSGYAWLTNAVPPDRPSRRLPLLAGMAGFLVMSLAIPRVFVGGGTAFAVGYAVVVVVHLAMYTRAGSRAEVLAILRVGSFNLAAAALLLAGGLLGGRWEYALWTLALLLVCASPYLIGDSGFDVRSAHFVERHGLVVIITLGESVVAIGIGAADLPVDAGLVAVAVLGLLLSAGLWWVYFGGDDVRAEHAMAAAPAARRPRLALNAFGYAHVPILLGVVALAVGVKKTIGHAAEHAHPEQALALAGGVALYLAGDVLFRRVLAIGRGGPRVLAALAALATYPIGVAGSAAGQLAALVLLLAATIAVEARLGAREAAVSAPNIPRTSP